jgi:twinkle protein
MKTRGIARKINESSEFVLVHQPCPCGKSSDAYCINEDGSGKCFSCNEFFKSTRGDNLDNEVENNEVLGKDFIVGFKPHRGLYAQTLEFFGVLCKLEPKTEEILEVSFPYPNGAIKLRKLGKKFKTTGQNTREPTLFGMDKFDPAAYGTLTIVEGEYDACAVHQMMGNETAVVSVRSSSTAKSDVIACWDYINSFQKIVLSLDNDEHGESASREIASLFDFNKVFKVNMQKHKDANDYLEHEDHIDYIRAWKKAARYTPDNIISTFSEIEESLKDSQEDMIGTYPFGNLQNALYGLHRGEVIVWKGDEGIGKTETFRAIEHHLLKTVPNSKIALLHLEEDEGTTVKGIATYEDKFPYVHPEYQVENRVIMDAFKKAVDNREDRVYIYESFDVEDENAILDNIRFLVKACGCEFVFLDHITWLATGLDNEDERRKLDRISQKLKLLAKELRFCLNLISHTNDDGKTRGSRNNTKVANTVIHMTRDKTHVNPDERNKMHYMIEKARTGGNTGPAGFAMFDRETMRLVDGSEYVKFELPGVGK